MFIRKYYGHESLPAKLMMLKYHAACIYKTRLDVESSDHRDLLGSGGEAKLTSALHGGECSVSWTGRFTAGKSCHGTHRAGGWVGPRDSLDVMWPTSLRKTGF